MNYEIYYQTDIGKVRQHNEDAVAVFKGEHLALMVVADGMGGHAAGEIASGIAINHISEKFTQDLAFASSDEARIWLKNVLESINADILAYAKGNDFKKGMGTTLVVAIIAQDFVAFAHVGDSRAYLLAYDELRQVTKDHTFVRRLVEQGQLSERGAKIHPQKNIIINALGTQPDLDFDFVVLERACVDAIMLCSDGLTGVVEDEVIADMMSAEVPVSQKVENLIAMANESGGKDNISVCILEFVKGGARS